MCKICIYYLLPCLDSNYMDCLDGDGESETMQYHIMVHECQVVMLCLGVLGISCIYVHVHVHVH